MKTYIISFGNSTKYRLNADEASLANLKNDIRKYLVKKFPQISDLSFFDKMTVTEVNPGNSAEYASYPEFNEESVSEIKKVLSTEVRNEESVCRLNSNAPWGE